jgi:hypothetical protein
VAIVLIDDRRCVRAKPSSERVGLKATGNEWPEKYMNGARKLGNRLRFKADRNYQKGRHKATVKEYTK